MNTFALALAIATADCPAPVLESAPPGLCQFAQPQLEVNRQRAFACEHVYWLRQQVKGEKQWRACGDYNHNPRRLAYLEEWLAEAEHDFAYWDALQDLCWELESGWFPGIDYVHPHDRLYQLLGHDDYVRGIMPPAAPFHRFQEE
jgi:hypothetical protein